MVLLGTILVRVISLYRKCSANYGRLGLAFLTIASSSVFVGCQVMFEVRQGEMRKGIYTKC